MKFSFSANSHMLCIVHTIFYTVSLYVYRNFDLYFVPTAIKSTITSCPDDIQVLAAPGSRAIQITYPPLNITNSNINSGPIVDCNPRNGSYFMTGMTEHIECTARDRYGFNSTCSFQVTVMEGMFRIMRDFMKFIDMTERKFCNLEISKTGRPKDGAENVLFFDLAQ